MLQCVGAVSSEKKKNILSAAALLIEKGSCCWHVAAGGSPTVTGCGTRGCLQLLSQKGNAAGARSWEMASGHSREVLAAGDQ